MQPQKQNGMTFIAMLKILVQLVARLDLISPEQRRLDKQTLLSEMTGEKTDAPSYPHDSSSSGKDSHLEKALSDPVTSPANAQTKKSTNKKYATHENT